MKEVPLADQLLHTNEITLSKLIEVKDQKTDSKSGFSEQLGKMLPKVNTMKPNYSFPKIDISIEVIQLRNEVVNICPRTNIGFTRGGLQQG